jgi:type II secretion system protein I
MLNERSQRGFTLIEVVVALAIFALCAGSLYEVLQSAMRRSASSERRMMAELEAASLLSNLRVRRLTAPTNQSGSTSWGARWTIAAQPVSEELREQSPWRAYEIRVAVVSADRSVPDAELHSVEVLRVDAP